MKSQSSGKGFYKVNSFDLTHDRKMSLQMGKLVPCMCEEVVPGDTFRVQSDLALRLAPMIAPMMHRVDVFVHYFFVPTRLLWDNWDTFLTGGRDGSASPVYPYIEAPDVDGFKVGSLGDYLGLPTGVVNDNNGRLKVSALPFRAYDMIYNEWYRDQNLIDPVGLSFADGVDSTTATDVQRRAWRKGYFESALPWAQRGQPVTIGLAGQAPVYLDPSTGNKVIGTLAKANLPSAQTYPDQVAHVWNNGGQPGYGTPASQGSWSAYPEYDSSKGMFKTPFKVDNSSATAITVRDMRLAFQIQKYYEVNGRGGVRYVEWLMAHFGVRSSDSRLQRPEFLGGGRSPVVVGEVLQTSSTDETSPQGNPSGVAGAGQSTLAFTRSFEEFGYVIGIVSVMPKPAYQQGLNRMWTRFGRFDQYLPLLAHVGDQAILKKEVCLSDPSKDSTADNDGVFGYAPRFEEFRKHYDTVHGDFRSSLDFWHLGRVFDTQPSLGQEFVECHPSKRVFAVTDENVDECWMHMLHNIRALRPIPRYGNPGLIDHG